MSKINITSESCIFMIDGIGDMSLNGESIGKIIKSKLLSLEEYKDYPARVNIEIEVLGQKGLNITTEGCKVEDKKESEDEE